MGSPETDVGEQRRRLIFPAECPVAESRNSDHPPGS